MARGWESKAVEEQINAKEAESRAPFKEESSPEQLMQRAKRESLVLARVRTLAALNSASNERYRASLVAALAHLDARIDELSGEN